MARYFKEYSTPGSVPSKNDVKAFLEQAKKVNEKAKEWDLNEYEQYLCDLYDLVGAYYKLSPEEFLNTDIDWILYLKDKILQRLEMNLDDDPKALPISNEHMALILTMRKLFGSKKK